MIFSVFSVASVAISIYYCLLTIDYILFTIPRFRGHKFAIHSRLNKKQVVFARIRTAMCYDICIPVKPGIYSTVSFNGF